MKNNPRYEQLLQQQKEEQETGKVLTEKERRIAELRKQLLAPQEKKAPVGAGGVAIRKPEADPMENKFKRVMDHGTPRLVTKNRQLSLNQSQIQSRGALLKFANVRKGDVKQADDDKASTGFAKSSVAGFRQKMMQEEKLDLEEDMQKGISYGLLPVPESKKEGRSASLAVTSISNNQM